MTWGAGIVPGINGISNVIQEGVERIAALGQPQPQPEAAPGPGQPELEPEIHPAAGLYNRQQIRRLLQKQLPDRHPDHYNQFVETMERISLVTCEGLLEIHSVWEPLEMELTLNLSHHCLERVVGEHAELAFLRNCTSFWPISRMLEHTWGRITRARRRAMDDLHFMADAATGRAARDIALMHGGQLRNLPRHEEQD